MRAIFSLSLFATKKGGGNVKNGRDSAPKYLGVKVHDGQTISAGGIIVRQRGTRIHSYHGAACGRDHTLFALKDGKVKFFSRQGRKYVKVV